MIMIAAPVRNRGYILPYYLQALSKLECDKIFYFLVNDSADESESILMQFEQPRVKIDRYDLNAPEDSRTKIRKTNTYYALAKLRNRILDEFLTSNADYLFSVDTDIIVSPDTVKVLLKHNKDIVSAHIFNAPGRKQYNNYLFLCGEKYQHRLYQNNGLIECDLTGAVYLIKREVIEAGVRYGYTDIGEDAYFCKMAQDKGYKLYCDTNHTLPHLMNKAMLEAYLK